MVVSSTRMLSADSGSGDGCRSRPRRRPQVGIAPATRRATVGPPGMIGSMNYELYMGEALAEARTALSRGERAHAAVAVMDEAMVARAHERVVETNDPTAHAVIVALREAARRLGTTRLADITIFATVEPCADVRRRDARERCRGPRLRRARPARRRGRAASSSSPSNAAMAVGGSRSSAASVATRPRSCLAASIAGPDRRIAATLSPIVGSSRPALLFSRAERCPSG